jgi:hypothetical protein
MDKQGFNDTYIWNLESQGMDKVEQLMNYFKNILVGM